MMEAAEEGDLALIEEMKKTLGKKSQGQAVPDSLDGKVTHDSILERFKDCYEELYNSQCLRKLWRLSRSSCTCS